MAQCRNFLSSGLSAAGILNYGCLARRCAGRIDCGFNCFALLGFIADRAVMLAHTVLDEHHMIFYHGQGYHVSCPPVSCSAVESRTVSAGCTCRSVSAHHSAHIIDIDLFDLFSRESVGESVGRSRRKAVCLTGINIGVFKNALKAVERSCIAVLSACPRILRCGCLGCRRLDLAVIDLDFALGAGVDCDARLILIADRAVMLAGAFLDKPHMAVDQLKGGNIGAPFVSCRTVDRRAVCARCAVAASAVHRAHIKDIKLIDVVLGKTCDKSVGSHAF